MRFSGRIIGVALVFLMGIMIFEVSMGLRVVRTVTVSPHAVRNILMEGTAIMPVMIIMPDLNFIPLRSMVAVLNVSELVVPHSLLIFHITPCHRTA
jgi:hypothetical protein